MSLTTLSYIQQRVKKNLKKCVLKKNRLFVKQIFRSHRDDKSHNFYYILISIISTSMGVFDPRIAETMRHELGVRLSTGFRDCS